jgi:NAD-dependent dihydropyrimidine dehydrogenase PreA subunit
MCELCVKHGEGKKWYLQAQNYSEELRSKLKVIPATAELGENFYSYAQLSETMVKKLEKLPMFMRNLVRFFYDRWQHSFHFGQVIPIEDLEQVLKMMTSVVRLPCLCRRYIKGTDERYCIGITMDNILQEPDMQDGLAKIFYGNPAFHDFEYMNHDEIINFIRELDQQEFVHTIWTIQTPYIAAICNCKKDACYGLHFEQEGLKFLYRAEFVAVIDNEKCTGCKACISSCQFDAFQYIQENRKVVVDPTKCYGCGICRVRCAHDAITLINRRDHSAAANIW